MGSEKDGKCGRDEKEVINENNKKDRNEIKNKGWEWRKRDGIRVRI